MDERVIRSIEKALVQEETTTILVREFEAIIEWSVACVGYMVGSVRMKLRRPLLREDVEPYGGIRLEIRREGLRRTILKPIV